MSCVKDYRANYTVLECFGLGLEVWVDVVAMPDFGVVLIGCAHYYCPVCSVCVYYWRQIVIAQMCCRWINMMR